MSLRSFVPTQVVGTLSLKSPSYLQTPLLSLFLISVNVGVHLFLALFIRLVLLRLAKYFKNSVSISLYVVALFDKAFCCEEFVVSYSDLSVA